MRERSRFVIRQAAIVFLVMAVCPGLLQGADFTIIVPDLGRFLPDRDESVTIIAIDGSYKEGVTEGSVGRLMRSTEEGDTTDVAEASVIKTNCWDSWVSIPSDIEGTVDASCFVRIVPVEPNVTELAVLSRDALKDREYCKAVHYLEKYREVCPDDSAVIKKIEQYAPMAEKEKSGQMALWNSAFEKTLAEARLKLAKAHARDRRFEAARAYVLRVLRFEPRNADAEYLRVLIEQKGRIPELGSDGDWEPGADEYVLMVVQPELIYKHKPDLRGVKDYKKLEGLVWIQCLVDESGRVIKCQVNKSSGHADLDSAAVEAGRKCEFKPAYLSGKPVKIWVSFPYEFVRGGKY
jgi:TonB family protein